MYLCCHTAIGFDKPHYVPMRPTALKAAKTHKTPGPGLALQGHNISK